MWLIHQFITDDSSADQFVGTVFTCELESDAERFIAAAPKAKSIVEGYAYRTQFLFETRQGTGNFHEALGALIRKAK